MSSNGSQPAAPTRRTILALGGHEFSRRRGNEALRDYILALTNRDEPRICLLPTASGDPEQQIAAFRRSFGELPCSLSHLSLFRLEGKGIDLHSHLLAQDLIYVGGGSMVNLLAVWRAHGIDGLLRDAWMRGTVLVGQSAGAMCWFEAGISRSRGGARTVDGLGLVPGILSVHYDRDPDRRPALHEAVTERGILGYGLDDQAGILIRGATVAAAVSGRDEAGVWRVEPGADGVREVRLTPAPLPAPRPAVDEIAADVLELRRLREVRSGMVRSRER